MMKFTNLFVLFLILNNLILSYLHKLPLLTLTHLNGKVIYNFESDSFTTSSLSKEKKWVPGIPLSYCKSEGCQTDPNQIKEVLFEHYEFKSGKEKTIFISIRIIYNNDESNEQQIYKRINMSKWTITAFAIFLKEKTKVTNKLQTKVYLKKEEEWHTMLKVKKVKHQLSINENHTQFKVLKVRAFKVHAFGKLTADSGLLYNTYTITHDKLKGITISQYDEDMPNSLKKIKYYRIKLSFEIDVKHNLDYLIHWKPLSEEFLGFINVLKTALEHPTADVNIDNLTTITIEDIKQAQ
jgi:hypothetical protein